MYITWISTLSFQKLDSLGQINISLATDWRLNTWLKKKERAWFSKLFHRTKEKYSILNILFSYLNMKDSI